jgi:hypothetical protein
MRERGIGSASILIATSEPVETGLRGWGGRTRTSEWRNQKSPCHFDFFTHFFPTGAESAHDASNGYGQIPDCSPQGGAHKNSLR